MANTRNNKARRICLLLVPGFAILLLIQTTGLGSYHQLLGEITNYSSVYPLNSKTIPHKTPIPRYYNVTDDETSHTKDGYGLKVTHVNFLKIHKAGSTTMQNLLFRFGLRYGLNILLPKHGNFLSRKKSVVAIPRREHFDIFAIHTIYNQQLIDSLLPNDTVNIAIVREPISRFISAAYYHRDVFHKKYLMKVPRHNYIHELVQHPDVYDTGVFSTTKNTMARDFGFPANIRLNDTVKISGRLKYLDTQFSLVMIMEKMDESLVLLRRLLNWSHLDIVYLKTNSHKHDPITLSPSEIVKYRKTSFLDFALYEYFEKRFEEKIARESEDLLDEVHHFKNILMKVKQFCDTSIEDDELKVERSKWSEKFNLRATECLQMTTKEMVFINEIRSKYYGDRT